jgi:hypothetical protein
VSQPLLGKLANDCCMFAGAGGRREAVEELKEGKW